MGGHVGAAPIRLISSPPGGRRTDRDAMITDAIFFRDLAYVFAAAVIGGAGAWLARQPLVLGYVVGGLAISPLTPGPSVSDLYAAVLPLVAAARVTRVA